MFSAIVGFFLNLATLVGPVFMIQVYGRVIPSTSHATLYGLMTIGAFGVVLFGVLDFVRTWTYSVLAHSLARRLNLPALRAGVIKSMRGGPNEGGSAIRDIAELRHFVSSNSLSTLIDACWSLIFITALFFIHAVYAYVAIGFIAVMLVCNIIADVLTRQTIKKANEAQHHHAQEVANSLRHAEAIEAMGMLPALVRVWRRSQGEMLEQARIAGGRTSIVLAFTKSLQKSLPMVTVATGAFLVLDNQISTSVLFAGMVLTSQAVGPFANMVESWRSWINAGQAWTRIKTLVEEEGSARQTMPAPVGDGDLLVENLVYIPEGRDVPVLHGISFSVSPGEVLGIAGPSGAGKSTLARCLTGIIKPTVGGVYLDGHSTWLWERGSFGKAVGYLPQSLSLLDGTIRQTIARMQDSDPRDVIRAAQQAGVHEMIGRLPHGYDTPVQEGMHMLSGGQLQRLALARALYGEPKLLILDEPNSNLDHVGEQALVAAIESVKARGGIVVMIAHRPSVMAIADKLMVIEDGSISQYGPRTEVIEMIMPGVRAVTRRPSA
ncbi:type I secretion system permease/ATPase [Rhizobium sp. FKL33]|uniref:type I secretion system permease/ATPase n=1 Tax=Rhizobium sp. FKL33 TaxID=2562307 RepID=UPI001FEE92DA|nr:type I secretion system permease/ATPase [Rhizobium sp. FKL33]